MAIKSNFLSVAVVCLLQAGAWGGIEIASISQNARSVGLYDKFELTFTLSQTYSNPFDPSVVDVTAQFVRPDGNAVTVPAFFYQDYDYVDGRYVNGRNPGWKVRFAPERTGVYRVNRIMVVDANGSTVFDPQVTFTGVASRDRGIVRRDPRDPSYLRYADRRAYLPIGHDVAWLPGGPGDWEHYFTQMGAVSENWTRIWMTHFNEGQTLEWSTKQRGYYHGVGRLSLAMGWKLDRMIELAEANGIAIQLVLQHHGQFSTTTNSNWNQNPYNVANAAADGGFLSKAEDFFTNPRAVQLTKNKFRYIVARWGYSRAILAWELFNEVQYTDGWRKNRDSVVKWHRDMANYIAALDPFDHLITTSSDSAGFNALWSLAGINVIQVHHYGTEPAAFIDRMTARLAGYGKPVLLGEFGVGTTGGSRHVEQRVGRLSEPYKTQMLEALDLHNGIWAAFHRKSGAHLWWWDSYIEPFHLYDQFRALSRYAAGEDPAAYHLSRADLDTTGLPRWVLVSPELTGFSDQSAQTSFTVGPDGTVSGTDKLSAWLHGASKNAYRSDPTFTLDVLEGEVLRIHVQEVSGYGNNSLGVLVDGRQIFSSTYPNRSGGFTIEVPLPAGRHAVKIENTGKDWFRIASYEFLNPSQGSLEFLGLAGSDHAYLWAHDTGSGYGRTAHGTFSGVRIVLRGLNDGPYVAEFHQTRGPGGVLRTQTVSSTAGRLALSFPDFGRDIAVKIKPTVSP